jgi:DNA-binding beta-propeller fold protein YncE
MRTSIFGLLSWLLLAGAQNAPTDRNQLEVRSWQPTRSGWLYVVDPTTDASSVFLVDPEHDEIAGIIRTGYSPDIAISPQGDRLYIASDTEKCGQSNCDLLAVVDTRSGRILSTAPIRDRVHYKLFPGPSTMMVSPDGKAVYLPVWEGVPNGDTPVGMAVFDTDRGRFLGGVIDLGVCGGERFIPTTDKNQLMAHCSLTNDVLVHRLIAPDQGAVEFSVHLPWGNRLFARHVYPDVPARTFLPSADGGRLFVVGGDGAISIVNLGLGSVANTTVLGNQSEMVIPFVSPGSRERGRLYVGVGPYDGEGLAREIRVVDTNTWMPVGTIRTSTPFRTAVATPDGSTVYALTAESGKVLIVDADALRELRAVPVGRAPSVALIAP